MSDGLPSSNGPIEHLERAALLLAACGTAVTWILPYVFANIDTDVPTWLVSRWYLLVCAPALLCGLGAFRRYGGFAKAPIVIAGAALVVVGVAWTDPTERGRGALLAAAILVPLPIAALIRRHSYLKPFLRAFSLTTAATLAYASFWAAPERFGRLADATGTFLTNPNSVGIQAGLAALFLLTALPRRKGLGAYLSVILAAVLTIFCIITGSRTAFLALAGAFAVSMVLLHSRSVLPIMVGAFVALCALGTNAVVDREHPFYQRIVERLVQDDEETMETFGNRTEIWAFAAGEFVNGHTWAYGTGTGGVDKTLGALQGFPATNKGTDGIWRLSAHNTLVWWAMAFGIPGVIALAWFGFSSARIAYQLDKHSGGWHRSALLTFVALAGFGSVITSELYWCVIEAGLLVMLSTTIPGPVRRPRMAQFSAYNPSGAALEAIETSKANVRPAWKLQSH
jgi:hypothetical protein